MPLKVLPDDSPCAGCVKNCCDPVDIDIPQEQWFPLNDDDPGQNQNIPGRIDATNFYRNHFIRRVKDLLETVMALCHDRRFSLKAVVLLREVQGMPSYIHSHPVTFEGMGEDGKDKIVHIQFMRVWVRFLLNCEAFDQTTRACQRYETRPEPCRGLSVDTCGFSSMSQPVASSRGGFYSRAELVTIHDYTNRDAQPTIEEAVMHLIEIMKADYNNLSSAPHK